MSRKPEEKQGKRKAGDFLSIIIALLIFSAIILFHEFGHFITAKKCGIKVLEFSLGMGPRIVSHVFGETRYSLKLLPFGGSCQMLGEDEEDMTEGSFGSKSVFKRVLTVAAGPVFNFLLAWILAVILLASAGYDEPVILGVSEDGAAAEAGIQEGDVIRSIDGKRIYLFREVSDFVSFRQNRMSSGEPIEVEWIRDGEIMKAQLVPKESGGRYVLGISGSSSMRRKADPVGTLGYGLIEVRYWIKMTYESLGMLFRGQVSINDMSGPVGVVSVISETYNESRQDGVYYIFLNMLNIAILLSANLGVMNLLPIPALDGGRLLFLLVEAIRGKKSNQKLEGWINAASFILLLLLMVFIMMNDIRKLV